MGIPSLHKRRREIVRRRIALAQGFEIPTPFDGPENRGRVIWRMIHKAALGIRGDDDGGDARPRSPSVDDRRRDVIPASSVLVIGDDNERSVELGTVADGVHQFEHVLLALLQARVAGVFVVETQRLDERDRRQSMRLHVG